MKRVEVQQRRLAVKRAQVEAQLAALQEEVRGQVGWRPRQVWMVVLTLGAAAGFALAYRLRSPRQEQIKGDAG